MAYVIPAPPVRQSGGGGGGIFRAMGLMESLRDRREARELRQQELARQEEVRRIVGENVANWDDPRAGIFSTMKDLLGAGHYQDALNMGNLGVSVTNAFENVARGREPDPVTPGSFEFWARANGIDPARATWGDFERYQASVEAMQPEPVPGTEFERFRQLSPEEQAEYLRQRQQFAASGRAPAVARTRGTGTGGGGAAAGAPAGMAGLTGKTAEERNMLRRAEQLMANPYAGFDFTHGQRREAHWLAEQLSKSTNPAERELGRSMLGNLPPLDVHQQQLNALEADILELGLDGDLSAITDNEELTRLQKRYKDGVRKRLNHFAKWHYDQKFGVTRSAAPRAAASESAGGRRYMGRGQYADQEPGDTAMAAAGARARQMRAGIPHQAFQTVTPAPGTTAAPLPPGIASVAAPAAAAAAAPPAAAPPSGRMTTMTPTAPGTPISFSLPRGPEWEPPTLPERRPPGTPIIPPGMLEFGSPATVIRDALGMGGGIVPALFANASAPPDPNAPTGQAPYPGAYGPPAVHMPAAGGPDPLAAGPPVTPGPPSFMAEFGDPTVPDAPPDVEAQEILEVLPDLPEGSQAFVMARSRYLLLRPQLDADVRKRGDKAFGIRSRKR